MFRSVFSAGILVRTLHTLLTWGVTLVLFLHDTDLYHQENQWKLLQPLLFGLFVLCSVLLYYTVSLMDPGYILSDLNLKSLPTYVELGMMNPEAPSGVRLRRCGYCFLQQPMRARHCKTCNHCVRRFDHHCPWIENCVGERNHPLFMLYLSVQFLVLLWAFSLAWSGFQFQASWSEWVKVNIFLLLAFALTGIFTIVVALLLGCQCYLISCNVTTWEFMSHYRISYLKHYDSDTNPFDKGICRNLWDFFCTCNNVAWEQVYFQGAYNTV